MLEHKRSQTVFLIIIYATSLASASASLFRGLINIPALHTSLWPTSQPQ